MLGWDIKVIRNAGPKPVCIARFSAGVFNLSWLDELVREGRAADLGGDGYPLRYSAAAGVLLPLLRRALPPDRTPPVIGEDGLQPAFGNRVDLREADVSGIPAGEILMVEAWDLS
jgi:hypothetical protein